MNTGEPVTRADRYPPPTVPPRPGEAFILVEDQDLAGYD